MTDNSNIVKNGFATGESAEAQAQLTPEEQKAQIMELLANSPSRQRARYTPDFTLTDEYKKMVENGESTIYYQRNGSYTDEQRQEDIDKSLAISLSEAISIRDKYMEEIQKLEKQIDSFSEEKAQDKVDQLTAEYKQKAKGISGIAIAQLKAEYDKEVDKVELELYTKPRNILAIKRYEAIEKYKVYENRVKLYVSANREAIAKRIETARDNEIDENLLALAEYME